jgi:hypothetical protein
VRYRRLPGGGIAVDVEGGQGSGEEPPMHPFTYAVTADLWREERLREAVEQRSAAAARRTRRSGWPGLRTALGYRLVEVGLRLAVSQPAPRLGARQGAIR